MAAETKFTVELGKRINRLVKAGNFRETAAAICDVDPTTLRSWLKRGARGEEPYAAFARAQDKAESTMEADILKVLRKCGEEDWRALAWILERRGAKRWGFKAGVEVSVEEELGRILDVIEQQLGSEAATRILAALTDGQVGPGAARGTGEAEGGPGPGGPVH
jgi:hypothetical protein